MKIDGITLGIQPNYTNYEPAQKVTETADNADKQIENAAADKQDETAVAAEEKKTVEAESKQLNAQVYGDVLAKNEMGDTVTAKKQSIDALMDGLVFPKSMIDGAAETLTNASRTPNDGQINPVTSQAAPGSSTNTDEKPAQDVQSFAGISASQLETMYLQGKISRYDYDQEIERRAELTQQEDTPTIAEQEAEQESKQEAVQEEIDNNNALAKNMTGMVADAADKEIKADALQTANENDRVDLMNQVFGAN